MSVLGSAGDCTVEAEHQLLDHPKRLDLVIEGKSSLFRNFKVLNYFKTYNLISYKSFRDNPRRKDFLDLIIYYPLYLLENPYADFDSTTITMICSVTPKKYLAQHSKTVREVVPGHYIEDHGSYETHIINIEKASLEGADGVLLSAFCRDPDRIVKANEIPGMNISEVLLDKLIAGYKMRMSLFENEEVDDMGAVADVTKLVMPYIEQARQEGMQAGMQKGIQKGIQKGRQEGMQKGMQKGMSQVAKGLKQSGISTEIISRNTGLTPEEIDKL